MLNQSNKTPEDEKALEHLESLTLLSRQSTPQPPINNMSTSTPPPTSSGAATPTQSFKFSFAKSGINKSSKSASSLSQKPLFQSHDDEEDEEHHKRSKVTSIENGAVVEERGTRAEKKDEPLVIKPLESHNEHWLQRRLKMFRPDMIESKPPEMDMSNIPDTIGNSTAAPGLQPQKRPAIAAPEPEEVETEMQVEIPKTADELARELLIKQAADPASSSSIPNIIIPAAQPLSESDVFSYDMAHLSNAPTLETYERVPVEAFGKGILLGLGWKEGTDLKGQKTEGFQEPKKRPDFLGIGAKEEEFLRLDAKGQKIQRKEGLGASWNPLKKVDKVTGEVIIEEKESRRGTPKDGLKERSRDSSRDRDRSGVSTPHKGGSRYGTPVGGSSGYDSSRDRDRGRDRDRDRRRDREDDKQSYSEDRKRRHGSDRERKHKYQEDSDYRSQDRDYDSDYYRKRRKEGDRSNHGSHRGSRQPTPERGRSGGSSRDRKDR